MPPPRLSHIHLGRTPYTHAATLQSNLVHNFHLSKTTPRPPPPPTILTAEFNPVYTLGRRDLTTILPPNLSKKAEVHHTLRGGQTTFHGPGQLTAYVILDLKSHSLRARTYVGALERALVATIGKFGIAGFTTEHTGVWTSAERKIAAVGVHVRSGITSFGVALNVCTDLRWFDEIVPCGLEGKEVTSFEREGVKGVGVEEVAGVFVEEMAKRVGCETVVRMVDDEEEEEKEDL